MSLTYTDLTETQFPDKIDELTRMSDLTSTDIPIVNEYYAYYNAGNMAAAAQLLASNPTLLDKLFNAAKFNILRDALIALQRFYMSDVQTYIDSTRQSLQDEVDQFSSKGEYSPTSTYQKFNIVTYQGSGYVCQKDNLTGIAPVVGQSNENWGLIAMKGDQGVSGTGLSWRGRYSTTVTYYKDDAVSDGHRIWAALQESTGQPLEEGEYWTIVMSMDYELSNAITSHNTSENAHLGILQTQHKVLVVSLTVASWVNLKQTITAVGVTPDNTLIVSPTANCQEVYTKAGVLCTAQSNDQLTFDCTKVPEQDVTVNIVILDK